MNHWIEWTKQIKAIAQIGTAYSKDKYDLERYDQLAGIAHLMIAHLSDAPLDKVDDFFVPDTGYATPKVDLRAGVIKNDKILLARERSDGKWTLPGGWADVGESPFRGIQREVLEETGYEVKTQRLIAVKDRSLHPYKGQNPNHIYKMFFLCDLVGGKSKANLEISEIAFFHPHDIPDLSEGRTILQDIKMVFDYFKDKNLSVYCD